MANDKNNTPKTGESSDIPDIDSLEKLPEPEEKKEPDKPEKKPKNAKNVIKGKSPMFSDADKSRAMGIAATIVCVAGLIFFVGWQMIAGMRENAPVNTEKPFQTGTVPADTGETNGENGSQPNIDIDKSNQSPSWSSPLDRAPWDYKLEDDDGNPAGGDTGAVSGGTRYWVKNRSGEKEFKIVIPAGYTATDMGDHIELMTVGTVPVDGDEPMELWWRYTSEIESVLTFGAYDKIAKTGTTGYDQWDIVANSYYMFKDENGHEYPVVTATYTKIEAQGSQTDPHIEYWIIVGKKSDDGKYLVATVMANSFQSLATQICPDIEHLAKALFPLSSEADPPAEWSQPLDYTQTSGDQTPETTDVLPD